MREKVFYIIMAIFSFLIPPTLFFDVYEYRYIKNSGEANVRVVDKYNLVNIKDVSNFPLIISIIFMVLSLTLAIMLIIDLIKGKYYRLHIKLLNCATTVSFIGLVLYFGIYLGILCFIIICFNLFILSFDLKLNKNKKTNLIIYIPTYLLFLVMMVLAIGFQPMR